MTLVLGKPETLSLLSSVSRLCSLALSSFYFRSRRLSLSLRWIQQKLSLQCSSLLTSKWLGLQAVVSAWFVISLCVKLLSSRWNDEAAVENQIDSATKVLPKLLSARTKTNPTCAHTNLSWPGWHTWTRCLQPLTPIWCAFKSNTPLYVSEEII